MATPGKKTQASDNSKIAENPMSLEDYVPISRFYNGRSIFITGGKIYRKHILSQILTSNFKTRERFYGQGPGGKIVAFMSGN